MNSSLCSKNLLASLHLADVHTVSGSPRDRPVVVGPYLYAFTQKEERENQCDVML
jgi:hypothetical protein